MLKTLAVVCLAAVAFGEPEAKADADPYLLYGGYGLGYSGYHPYAGYGYGYYGKREADAEPKADADPYLLYGGYGLGHVGYHYPAYSYGHLGYYGKRSADAEPRLKLILISSMADITDLAMPAMDFTILPMVAMLTMERDLPMLNPRLMLTPTFFMVDTD